MNEEMDREFDERSVDVPFRHPQSAGGNTDSVEIPQGFYTNMAISSGMVGAILYIKSRMDTGERLEDVYTEILSGVVAGTESDRAKFQQGAMARCLQGGHMLLNSSLAELKEMIGDGSLASLQGVIRDGVKVAKSA